ncbi:alpha/beta fold hydrolase [Haliangium sp.]|uniref:alpha/beta fold hydrolase n=1 Tax=Haliangium sp. TaxID=2663208 RepID=UPI003D10BC70
MSGEAEPRFALSRIDGIPIFYDIVESETGRPDTVVMCDGIGCDGYVWKHLRRALAPRYRLLHWHYPGHGRSASPQSPEHATIEALADDLLCVMDDAGSERVIACGHSMGVQVVLETYRRAPARVRAMVLMCGAPENPLRSFRGTDRFEALLPTVKRLADRAPGLFNRISRKLLPTRLAYEIATLIEPNEALIDRRDFMPYLEGMARVDVQLFMDMLSGAVRHSAVDLLGEIDVPTLIIGGSDDGFTPPALSTRMHAAIPDAEIHIVASGSHTAPIERPDEVDAVVLDFLQRRLSNPDTEDTSPPVPGSGHTVSTPSSR